MQAAKYSLVLKKMNMQYGEAYGVTVCNAGWLDLIVPVGGNISSLKQYNYQL